MTSSWRPVPARCAAICCRKKKLPDAPLIAFVPVSLREAGNTDINNQVFGMNCPLATHIEDPLKRLERIVNDSGGLKTAVNSVKSMAPQDFTLLGAPLLLPGLMKLYGRTKLADVVPQVVNVAISNTPGPPFPLYCRRCEGDGALSGFHRHSWRRP